MMKILMVSLVLFAGVSVHAFDEAAIKKMRQETEESTKKYWLVVVGLHWLKDGESSLGSNKDSNIVLPATVPNKLGKINFSKNIAKLTIEDAKNVKIDGKPAVVKKTYTLKTDKAKKERTEIQVGTVSFYLIERPNGIGVRVKDETSETLKNFKGLKWWEPKKDFYAVADWKPYSPPKMVRMPDILGNSIDTPVEGSAVFKLKGKSFELFPIKSENNLMFVIKDLTSGKTSYGAGRFLDSELKDGKVVMDFNQAYNPPCAHIAFATCPIPPEENKMDIAIEAGEKTPPGH